MNRAVTSLRVLLAALVAFALPSWAVDVDWQSNRLVSLTKVTVGPWDNFEASVAPDESSVFYTLDRNRIPNVYRQDLRTDHAEVFIGETGDAKEPRLDPTGKRLAVTFYGKDAQGDVCLVDIETKQLDCITHVETSDQSPFWLDVNTVGYLRRTTGRRDWELVSHALPSKQIGTIASGNISAPVASRDGRYVLFNRGDSAGLHPHVFDRTTQTTVVPARFDVSGITGYMAFSVDGRFVYFNQYLNDTNFDQTIDGNDHSVAFRVPFSEWLNAKAAIFPEQLTSVENNCKFPEPTAHYLFLTCAYEGSLDIYRLPLDGAVPSAWDEKKLTEAHEIARSYESRLLILNTLRYRYRHNEASIIERLLSNHLEIGELTAAAYFVAQLEKDYATTAGAGVVSFYRALRDLIAVRSSKQRVPVGIVTARFERLTSDVRGAIRKQDIPPRMLTLVEAYFDFELEQNEDALRRLGSLDLSQAMLPLERYLAFDLYRDLLEQSNPRRLLDLYPGMFSEPTLSLEARLYYAFEYLKLLQKTEVESDRRVEALDRLVGAVSDLAVRDLFQSELFSIRLAMAKEPRAQGDAFKALSELLKRSRANLTLRKAMHTRAIQVLAEAEQFQYLELLSRHWLTTTHVSEMEFYNVAEQYSLITMDKAYGMLSTNEPLKAYNTFYSVMLQSNDLEAHYQFLTLGLSASTNKRDNLDQVYQALSKENKLGEVQSYVAALRKIIESKGEAKSLSEAEVLLSGMSRRTFNPAMRDLLLGYIYHRQLRAARKGYDYDKTLFQKAHYHYVMALDLGRENSRIAATLWENLAWLHFDVGNYGLSADFFAHRLALQFVDAESEANTRWMYARTLFYVNRPDEAWQQAEMALKLARTVAGLDVAPFHERAAFYAVQAGEYGVAVKYYEDLLTLGKLAEPNATKAILNHAYALLRLGNREQAVLKFNSVIERARHLRSSNPDTLRLVGFRPERLTLLSYGFLTQTTDDPKKQAAFRAERAAIWKKVSGHSAEYTYKEADVLSMLAKDHLYMAMAYEDAGLISEMVAAAVDALKTAAKWSKETGDPVGPVAYRTLVNYLSLGISHPERFAAQDQKWVAEMATAARAEFGKQQAKTPVNVATEAKLALLWEVYAKLVTSKPVGKNEIQMEGLLSKPDVMQLEQERPDAYAELKELEAGLRKSLARSGF